MNELYTAPNDYRNYLEHFGVKGMKWGVRRYQNPDGTLTAAGKKRYLKQLRKEMKGKGRVKYINEYVQYDIEYEKTTEGKQKLKEYQKLIRKIESDNFNDDNDDFWNHFYKVEEDYLHGAGKYSAEKFIQKHGEEVASIYITRGRTETLKGKELVEMFMKHEVDAHSY